MSKKYCHLLVVMLLVCAPLATAARAALSPAIYDLGALSAEVGGNTPQSQGYAINAMGRSREIATSRLGCMPFFTAERPARVE
jgi:hypothetical protein